MKNKQKVTQILWHYPHFKFWMGGAKYLLEVTSRINSKYNNNFLVTVISNLGANDNLAKFKKKKVNIITYSIFSTNDILYWLFFPISILYDIIVLLIYSKKNKADILIATLFPSNFIMYITSLLFKKNYYYYCYEPYPFFHNKKYIRSQTKFNIIVMKLLAFLYGWMDTLATRKAKKVFTLNIVTKKMIKLVYKVDSEVTLMGVDTNIFKPSNDMKMLKIYGKYFIHSTDYTKMKNTDLVVKSFKLLTTNYPNSKLIITSTQPNSSRRKIYFNLVSKLNLEKQISFLGLVSLEKLVKLYSNAICYLSASYDEMLGTTSSNLPVKEALACGTPAIRAPITKEDVEDGVSGFLIDPRNVKKVAEKMEFLLNNLDTSKKMGMKGRKKIIKLYRWERVASVIINNIKRSKND